MKREFTVCFLCCDALLCLWCNLIQNYMTDWVMCQNSFTKTNSIIPQKATNTIIPTTVSCKNNIGKQIFICKWSVNKIHAYRHGNRTINEISGCKVAWHWDHNRPYSHLPTVRVRNLSCYVNGKHIPWGYFRTRWWGQYLNIQGRNNTRLEKSA